jgi:signal transduction histidine kinase
VARQAGVAIQNARLFEAEQRRVALLTTLHEIGLDLSAQRELPKLLETILAHIGRLLDTRLAAVFFLQPDGRTLEQVMALPSEYVETGSSVRMGEGLVGRIAATGEPLVVGDYSQWTGRITTLRPPARAMVGVPVKWQERVIGVIVVADERPDQYGSETVETLRLVANQATVAIQNARLFEQVRAGREQLQALSHRLVEVQEEERRHIARELHDEIGQTLTGLKLVLQVIPRLPAEAASAKLKDALQLVNELMGRAHDLSLDLRPAMLDDLGLPAALIWLFERYQTQTGVHVTFEFARLEERLAPEVETTAYRIVQEALTNVARHARVKAAAVWLLAADDALRIQIQDEGLGFDVQAALAAGKRAGVVSMKERAALLGGWLKVDSTPGSGTQVIASLPLSGRLERRKYDRLNSVGG